MKQSCIGIDIIEIDRIRESISRWGERFLRRIYTGEELALCQNKPESLAARFAGKEAAIKALSRPGEVISWKEIEILSAADGRPLIRLHGQAQARARSLKLHTLEVSLSHSRDNAIALVIGLGE